ncbi:MAG TPA: glycosyl hydrolase family 8 [Fibrobacteria bacterium]|nr:glycosyl hydrolase family 8 [Fibrobacteria bacterium]
MSRVLKSAVGAMLLGAVAASAAYLPYPEPILKYPRMPAWDDRLAPIYQGWKSRFVKNGLVGGRTPTSSEITYISEGQSYGMLLALWFGDQAGFNAVWEATENQFWTGKWYRWKSGDDGFAGDADIDICGALIFASALVDAKHWNNYTVKGNDYKAKAKIVMQSIAANFFDNEMRIKSWSTASIYQLNPSYHMPGWYPIFKEFGAANGVSGVDWDAATRAAYSYLKAQPNWNKGMARNFSKFDGGTANVAEDQSSPNPRVMGFDAIRVPLRMAHAALWYKQPDAVAYGVNVWKAGVVKPGSPGLYDVDNATILNTDYETMMPRAMWGALAVAVQDESAESKAARDVIVPGFASAHMRGNPWFDGNDPGDTASVNAPKANYYAQSLALLGALVMSGRAWNVWDDLMNPWVPPDTALKVTTPLKASAASFTKGVDSMILTATLSRAERWVLSLKGKSSGAVWTMPGSTKDIRVVWKGAKTSGTTAAFENEEVEATLSPVNSSTTFRIITSGSSVKQAVRGSGSVRMMADGIWLDDPALVAGEAYNIVVRDLNGRVDQAMSGQKMTKPFQDGLLIQVGNSTAPGVKILELQLPSSNIRRQYVLAPKP